MTMFINANYSHHYELYYSKITLQILWCCDTVYGK